MSKPILAAAMGVAFGLFLGGLFFWSPRLHSCHCRSVTIIQTEPVFIRPMTPYRPCYRPKPAEPVAEQPAAPEALDSDTLISAAHSAFLNGDYPGAVTFARQAEKDSPNRAFRLIGAMACTEHDRPLIEESFQHLNADARRYMISVCQRNGIKHDRKGFHFPIAK
jgi:hypothetical protein